MCVREKQRERERKEKGRKKNQLEESFGKIIMPSPITVEENQCKNCKIC